MANSTDATILLEAIVDAIQPVDGTLDAEASRRSLWNALSDLLDAYPEADLAALDADQRWFVIERFVALDVYNLFCRDMLKTVLAKAPDCTTGLARLEQVESYIIEVVAANFRKTREQSAVPSTAAAALTAHQAIVDTFAVFESYVT